MMAILLHYLPRQGGCIKKLAITLLLLLIAACAIQTEARGLQAGVKLGPTLFETRGGGSLLLPSNNPDLSWGFCGGMCLRMPVSKTGLSFQLDMQYVEKGAQATFDNTESSITDRLELRYFETAITYHIDVLRNRNLTPGFFTGPTLGILLHARTILERYEDSDRKDLMKPLEFSWLFGTELRKTSGKLDFVFELSYSFGLSGILDDDEVALYMRDYGWGLETQWESDITNSGFKATIGVMF